MGDLSKRLFPETNISFDAVINTDLDARRSFEVYGGKDSGAPPLGRVPKKCKLTPKDFRCYVAQDSNLMKPRRRGFVTGKFI
mmetsp:Transcript_6903/g.10098  ORF Transcript_6903/g.10098 Transcript_6903/m.10098 type:complete len:82 (-) Transcript_6903:96-341(-)